MGPQVDGDRLTFRVRSRAATWIEVWRYAEATDADPVEVVPLTKRGDVWEGSTTWSGSGDPLYYGLRAWGPNWEHDDAWVPGSEIGFVAHVDGAGDRFDPNKLLLDPEGREISHDPVGSWSVYTTGPDHRAEDSGPVAPKSVIVPDADPPQPGPDRAPEDEVVYEVHVRG
jgi:glycogen operon protein